MSGLAGSIIHIRGSGTPAVGRWPGHQCHRYRYGDKTRPREQSNWYVVSPSQTHQRKIVVYYEVSSVLGGQCTRAHAQGQSNTLRILALSEGLLFPHLLGHRLNASYINRTWTLNHNRSRLQRLNCPACISLHSQVHPSMENTLAELIRGCSWVIYI